jgi:hypothetical protein
MARGEVASLVEEYTKPEWERGISLHDRQSLQKTEEVSLLLILAISNVLCITANCNCMFVGT